MIRFEIGYQTLMTYTHPRLSHMGVNPSSRHPGFASIILMIISNNLSGRPHGNESHGLVICTLEAVN